MKKRWNQKDHVVNIISTPSWLFECDLVKFVSNRVNCNEVVITSLRILPLESLVQTQKSMPMIEGNTILVICNGKVCAHNLKVLSMVPIMPFLRSLSSLSEGKYRENSTQRMRLVLWISTENRNMTSTLKKTSHKVTSKIFQKLLSEKCHIFHNKMKK